MSNINAETTNPVIDTARLTLSQLAAAGVSEAAAIAEHLGLTNNAGTYGITEQNNTLSPMSVMQEGRYRFLNRCFCASGTKNFMDIACGFSPRGLAMARSGMQYLGIDLESAVGAMSGVAKLAAKKEKLPGSFSYILADATDPASLVSAADRFDGAVAMGCEGLIVYLTNSEFENMIRGIAAVLHRHGGSFYTPDFCSYPFFIGILGGILGEEGAKAAIAKLQASIENKSNVVFGTTATGMKLGYWIPIFEKYGLKCEMVPVLAQEDMLTSFDKLTQEQVSKIRESLASVCAIRLSPIPGSFTEDSIESSEFTASADRVGTAIRLTLSGRLDSVTAPDFLKLFEKARNEQPVTEIIIDAAKLEYISSAGLRTIMIMQKAMESGRPVMKHPNALIRDILEQTAFDTVLDIEE